MRITVSLPERPDAWIAGLQRELPDAVVEAWTPGAAPADHAVVWAPSQRFIDEQRPTLRGIFNIGAGVDALLALRIPDSMRIVRLDDAGMSVQMAEYVCHALIRHFRAFDGYEADAKEGRWGFRRPRARRDFPVGVMGLGVLGRRVGGSTGTNLWACMELIEGMAAAGETGSVVTLLCDGGDRYGCTYYDDGWLAERKLAWQPAARRIAAFLR